MVAKIQAVIIAECRKNATTPPKFNSVQRNGAVVWTIDAKSQTALRQGAGLEPKSYPGMNVFVMAVPDVMARLKPTMAHQFSSPGGPQAEDVAKLFGSRGNGLVFSQGHEGQTIAGSLFIPLDYEAAIHLISLTNQASRQNGAR